MRPGAGAAPEGQPAEVDAPCHVCGGAGVLAVKQREARGAAEPGRVTPLRRQPPGWVVPGPPARGAIEGRPELVPRAGEELCSLVGHWRIFQRVGGHRYTTEDVVTAWYAGRAARGASAAPPTACADVGCGIGSVLMMVAWQFTGARCIGVEAQAGSHASAVRSIAFNGADEGGRCEARLGDLRNVAAVVPEGAVFDLVTGTPPYFQIKQTAVGGGEEKGAGGVGAAQGGMPSCKQVGGRAVHVSRLPRPVLTRRHTFPHTYPAPWP